MINFFTILNSGYLGEQFGSFDVNEVLNDNAL